MERIYQKPFLLYAPKETVFEIQRKVLTAPFGAPSYGPAHADRILPAPCAAAADVCQGSNTCGPQQSAWPRDLLRAGVSCGPGRSPQPPEERQRKPGVGGVSLPQRRTEDGALPWYQSVLLPHLPNEGEVVMLLCTNSSASSSFVVIGLTGGAYTLNSTDLER